MSNPVQRGGDRVPALPFLLIVAAVTAAYGGTLHVPFLLDDHLSIATNPSLHHWQTALFPPPAAGVGGRPLLNLTFAANVILGHGSLALLHAVNLAIHAAAACLLFDLLRPTLPCRTPLALAIALLWALHPLQTEAVTYLSQRAEALMGLFYLLTLHAFARGRHVTAWLACLAGMATKETMVTAPLMVLLYDRAFLAGSFREAWRQRGRVHLALASTWIVLALLMHDVARREVGFGQGASAMTYALTECGVMLRYLRLIFWPHPLVFDYGLEPIRAALPHGPRVAAVAALLALTVALNIRFPKIGFPLAWFFLILAPTSSFVPLPTQPMAESRLYLPLAGVISLAAYGLWRLGGRRAPALLLVLSAACGFAAAARNRDYLSPLALWTDTLAKNPSDARAHSSLAYALAQGGRKADAIREDDLALRLDPAFAEARFNLGLLLAEIPGRDGEAVDNLEAAIAGRPELDSAALHPLRAALEFNVANDEKKLGGPDHLRNAIDRYGAALQLKPDWPEAHNNLGSALLASGRVAEAAAEYAAALRLKPDFMGARLNLARARALLEGDAR